MRRLSARLLCRGCRFRLGQVFIQGTLDVTDERCSEGFQQQTEGCIEPDVRIGYVDLAVNARTVKVQSVATPFAAEMMLGSEHIGGMLHQRSCLRDRQRVTSDKRDIGHTQRKTER